MTEATLLYGVSACLRACVPACLPACVRVVILSTNNNVLRYLLLIVFPYVLLRKFLINLLNTFINIVALMHVDNLTVGVSLTHSKWFFVRAPDELALSATASITTD